MTVPNTRPKVADQVFATLLEAILGGRYAPGERLPGQRALARDLGVTMTVLREALKRLEQMGLIDVRHGDAMRVNDVRERGTLDVLAPLLLRDGRLDIDVLSDVFEARTLMLSELGAMAALRRDDEQAARLRGLADAIAAAPDDETAQEIDFAWATELAQAAGNLVFILILNAIRSAYFANASALPVTADHAGLASLYDRAAAAIERQDPSDARAAIRALALAQGRRVGAEYR